MAEAETYSEVRYKVLLGLNTSDSILLLLFLFNDSIKNQVTNKQTKKKKASLLSLFSIRIFYGWKKITWNRLYTGIGDLSDFVCHFSLP